MQLWLMVSGVWNDFGLQMDLDPPLEGRLQEERDKESDLIKRFTIPSKFYNCFVFGYKSFDSFIYKYIYIYITIDTYI
jgi:hypothetical protein